MILVEKLVSWGPKFAHTQVTIRRETLFMERMGVPAYVGLEYMAQTAGVWRGIMDLQENRTPQMGYLLGTRELGMTLSYFKKGWCLDIHTYVDFIDETIGSFRSWIEHEKTKVLWGNITVYSPKKETSVPAARS